MPYASLGLAPSTGLPPGLDSNEHSGPDGPTFITMPYQVSVALASNPTQQFVMGPGTAYMVEKFLDLAVTDLRADRVANVRRHGVTAGVDLLGSHTDTLEIVTFPDATLKPQRAGSSAVQANHDALMGAWYAGLQDVDDAEGQDVILRFMLPGGAEVRRYYGRAGKATPTTGTAHLGYQRVTLEFEATDPVQYADVLELSSVVPLVPPVAGGAEFPVTFPITWGASGAAEVYATNRGQFTGELRVVVSGPLSNPRVENLRTGQYVAANIDVPAGQVIVFDFATQDFYVGATVDTATTSVYETVGYGTDWWSLPRGNTIMRLSGVPTGAQTATIQALWRSAWL